MPYKNYQNADVYQRITDYVIEALEKGEVPWQKRWNSMGLPRNITSGHQYRGWNVFFLNYATILHEYRTPFFITFRQAVASGGYIRKGEKGFPVIYWAVVEDKQGKKKDAEASQEQKGRTRLVPKLHIVFNIDQTENLAFALPQVHQKNDNEKIQACEQLVMQMPKPPQIKQRGDEAYYSPVWDEVVVPPISRFDSAEDYYNTLFHELAHSTGHKTRLNRKELMETGGFGSELYSKEELTAEFTAAYLSAITSIERKTIDNSTAYIRHWLQKLRSDKTLILKASVQAQAAADYILDARDKSLDTTISNAPLNQPITSSR